MKNYLLSLSFFFCFTWFIEIINFKIYNSRPSTIFSTTEKVKQEATAMPVPLSSSTQQPSQSQGTPDPYLTHFDPRSEHQSYKQAQMRLEEVHKEKVTKVSKSIFDKVYISNEMHVNKCNIVCTFVCTYYLGKKYYSPEHWCRNLCATTFSGDEGLE